MAPAPPRRIPPETPGARERFEASYEVDSETGCWLWKRGTFSQGYGGFSINGASFRAHRVSYAWANGDTCEELDHVCHNPKECFGGLDCPHRRCVNPAHLEPVTHRENVLRGGGPTARNARSEVCGTCGSGYKVNNRGERYCPKCGLEATKRYQAENRERVLARRRELRKVVHAERECAHPECSERFVPLRATGVFCKEPECVKRRARESCSSGLRRDRLSG